LVALAGCSREPEAPGVGQRPPNIPIRMPDARPSKPVGTAEDRAKLVADRLKQAEAATDERDYAKAIDKLREAILAEPKDRKVILELARANQARSLSLAKTDPAEAYRSMFTASNYLRTLRDDYPELTAEEKALASEVYFNEATQQAMSLRVEETTGALNDAIGAGFTDFDRVRNSPDWKKMLAVPQFKEFWDDLDKRFPSKK
jgi:hypothetical protein